MTSAYIVLTPPSSEPINLQDVKNYLRVDFTDDDTVIQELITRARAYAEMVTGRALVTQTIREEFTLEPLRGGWLSGEIDPAPNWYQYQEQLGANPFGPAMYYFDLSVSPVQSISTVQTRTTIFDSFSTYTGVYTLDNTREPARLYFQSPPTANQWRFEYSAGYSSTYPVPPDLLQPMYEAVAYWYEFREAQDLPQAITDKLLSRRARWV